MSELQVNLQVPSSSPKFNTDGRTDGLTKNVVTDVDQLSVVTARECCEITSVGEVIAAGELWPTQERHELVRTGEREPIPNHIRAAVWFRDSGRCADCHPEYPSGDPLHLDHIQPWSNGGPDTTDNLRLLCERHNIQRSNFIDYARPKRPATWWCSNCYVIDERLWEYHGPFVTCPIHKKASASRCRVARAYMRAHEAGDDIPAWHQRRLLEKEELTTIAYCAHCNAPGMTGYPL